jgi:hypothetical protein
VSKWFELFRIYNYSNNRDLEIKMNRLDQMRCNIRRTLNNKPRKDTQTQLHKPVEVHLLTQAYGSEIWTITKNRNCRDKSLRSVAGYTRKDQIRSTKIREELNMFNVNNKILKSKSQWKYHFLGMEHRQIPKKI